MNLRLVAVSGAAFAVGASRWLARARLPDDYDSIGFVRAVGDYDLARLQPHFPGYPVYVRLAKLAHRVLPDPLAAATTVSALSAAVTTAAVWHIARATAGPRVGACAVGLYAAAFLPWLLGGAALSDGTATALAVLAFAAVAGERPRWALGAASAADAGRAAVLLAARTLVRAGPRPPA